MACSPKNPEEPVRPKKTKKTLLVAVAACAALAAPAFTGTAAAAGTHYFPLHRVSTGNGTGWAGESYANPGGWIASAWIELCRMEGTTVLSCVSSKVMYAPFDDSNA
ncbi:hypothetical protein ACF07T_19210 [Streptomyces sp. NPDC015184]|uniref:hypothetical protein n=1 Tax=Streptomyces sp. NPDC015184 TaxID=3364946 RepID=UPI003700D61F